MRKTRTVNLGIEITGFIEAPARTSFAGTIIVLSVVAALSTVLAVPAAFNNWTLAVLAGLISAALIGKAIYAVHAALLAFLWLSLIFLVPSFRMWPLNILTPLVAHIAADITIFSILVFIFFNSNLAQSHNGVTGKLPLSPQNLACGFTQGFSLPAFNENLSSTNSVVRFEH